jgi:hypothetical protein
MSNNFPDYTDPTSQKGILYGIVTNGVFLAILLALFATGLVGSTPAAIESGLLIIAGAAIGSATVFLFRRNDRMLQIWNKFSLRFAFIVGFIIVFQILERFSSIAFSIVLVLVIGAIVGDLISRMILYFRIN